MRFFRSTRIILATHSLAPVNKRLIAIDLPGVVLRPQESFANVMFRCALLRCVGSLPPASELAKTFPPAFHQQWEDCPNFGAGSVHKPEIVFWSPLLESAFADAGFISLYQELEDTKQDILDEYFNAHLWRPVTSVLEGLRALRKRCQISTADDLPSQRPVEFIALGRMQVSHYAYIMNALTHNDMMHFEHSLPSPSDRWPFETIEVFRRITSESGIPASSSFLITTEIDRYAAAAAAGWDARIVPCPKDPETYPLWHACPPLQLCESAEDAVAQCADVNAAHVLPFEDILLEIAPGLDADIREAALAQRKAAKAVQPAAPAPPVQVAGSAADAAETDRLLADSFGAEENVEESTPAIEDEKESEEARNLVKAFFSGELPSSNTGANAESKPSLDADKDPQSRK